MSAVEADDKVMAADFARLAGITVKTLWVYVNRGTVPKPDGRDGSYMWWHRATFDDWQAKRRPAHRPVVKPKVKKQPKPKVVTLLRPHEEHWPRVQPVKIGMTVIRPGRPVCGTTLSCSCGWRPGKISNEAPSKGGRKRAQELYQKHVEEVTGCTGLPAS